MEKEWLKLQVAWFFCQPFSGPFETLASDLRKVLNLTSNAIVTIVPIPADASGEIPRLLMNDSADTGIIVKVSRARLDLLVSPEINNATPEQAVSYAQSVNQIVPVSVNRLGVVKSWFVSESSAQLKTKLLNEAYRERDFSEVSARVNEPADVQGIRCNNLEWIQPGRRQIGDAAAVVGVIVERDLNTSNTSTGALNKELLSNLIADFDTRASVSLLSVF